MMYGLSQTNRELGIPNEICQPVPFRMGSNRSVPAAVGRFVGASTTGSATRQAEHLADLRGRLEAAAGLLRQYDGEVTEHRSIGSAGSTVRASVLQSGGLFAVAQRPAGGAPTSDAWYL